jgi:hypothetical protein
MDDCHIRIICPAVGNAQPTSGVDPASPGGHHTEGGHPRTSSRAFRELVRLRSGPDPPQRGLPRSKIGSRTLHWNGFIAVRFTAGLQGVSGEWKNGIAVLEVKSLVRLPVPSAEPLPLDG